MEFTDLLLIIVTLVELLLLSIVVAFFTRLKKSETLVHKLQSQQEAFVNKLQFNAQLEQELVQSFEKRQLQLAELDQKLEERANELDRRATKLDKLLKQASELNKSPRFLRQVILSGHKDGTSIDELARTTGLSLEDVKLILDQAE